MAEGEVRSGVATLVTRDVDAQGAHQIKGTLHLLKIGFMRSGRSWELLRRKIGDRCSTLVCRGGEVRGRGRLWGVGGRTGGRQAPQIGAAASRGRSGPPWGEPPC
jgi:hypothetical protein